MKQHSVLRRSVLAAGLCLLLVGILTVSLGWATTSPSLPVAALQARAGGEAARTGCKSVAGAVHGRTRRAAGSRRCGPRHAGRLVRGRGCQTRCGTRGAGGLAARPRGRGLRLRHRSVAGHLSRPRTRQRGAWPKSGRAAPGGRDRPAGAHPGVPHVAARHGRGRRKQSRHNARQRRRGAHRGRSRLRATSRRRLERGRGFQRQLRARQRSPGLPRRHGERARDARGGTPGGERRGGGAGERRR